MFDGDDVDWETPRKLFVGGVNYDADDDCLRRAFEQFGDIVDCVIIQEPNTKRSRGFGFVTFHDVDSIQKVFDARPIKVEGRYVEVKRAVPRHETTATTPLKGATKKAFVGGIPTTTTEEQLRALFNEFGPIANIDIMRDKEGHSRGFAFIVFEDCESVEHVVQRQFIDIDGKKAECKRAEPFGSIQPTRALERSRKPPGKFHDEPFERPGPYNHPVGQGRQFNDMGPFDGFGGGFSQQGFSQQGFAPAGFRNSGFGGPGFGGPGFGGVANPPVPTFPPNPVTPAAQPSMGVNFGFQDFYAAGFGRGAGFDASMSTLAPTDLAQLAALGRYNPQPSNFGPARVGYSIGGGGAMQQMPQMAAAGVTAAGIGGVPGVHGVAGVVGVPGVPGVPGMGAAGVPGLGGVHGVMAGIPAGVHPGIHGYGAGNPGIPGGKPAGIPGGKASFHPYSR